MKKALQDFMVQLFTRTFEGLVADGVVTDIQARAAILRLGEVGLAMARETGVSDEESEALRRAIHDSELLEVPNLEPRPGDCYTRRWNGVDRENEQIHVTVQMLGMGVDKPLIGVTRHFMDHIMTRIAFDEDFVRCPSETHNHRR